MEHSLHSRQVLGGKNVSSSDYSQMELRSGSRMSSNVTDGSTNLKSSRDQSVIHQNHHPHISQQSPQHHHHQHHHYHEQSQNFAVYNHQHYSHKYQKQYTISQKDTSQSEHVQQSKIVDEGALKKISKQHRNSFSDYSSGIDEFDTDTDVKTDYTYAKSGSYNSRITPNRECASPNMSRSRLRRTSASKYSDESLETEDELFLKSKSQQSLSNHYHRTSTPAITSHGIEKNLFAFHKESGEQLSYLGEHSSESMISQAMSSLSSFTSVVSHTIYKVICTATSVDTFILSRCCSSPSRKGLVLFLFLLLPLLWLIQSLLTSSEMTTHFSSNYLSSLSSKSSLEALQTTEKQVLVNTLDNIETQKLYAEWQSNLEKKIHEELERRWLEQTKLMESRWLERLKQMENWQGVVSDQVSNIDIKTVKVEVSQLRSELESQIRKEEDAKSNANKDLILILDRLNMLENKQKNLEATLADLEDCCKKQVLLPVGVSQAELAAQLSALAQEVRTNLSQLVLLQSTAAAAARMSSTEDLHFTQNINSSYTVPTLGEIQKIIKIAIDRYDADKTGLVDYALESAGGSVISTRCTESYPQGTAQFSLFGVPFWYSAHTPRTVIQPQVHPGECWAMRGTQGYLVIQLSAVIRPTAFSLEHIPRELSPTGKIDSAPKEFSVIGLRSEQDMDGTALGRYVYEDNGEALQKFNVQNAESGVFSIVELRVHSNHGNPEYTCLYRFRVHGIRQ